MQLIGSWLLYFIMFMISTVFFAIAGCLRKHDKNANMLLHTTFVLLGVLIPSIFAGIRADDVGVDVNIYIVPHMRAAFRCESFAEVIATIDAGIEVFYAFLVYFVSRFTKDAGLLMFALQLLTITPIVMAVNKMRERVSLPIAMLVYFFCFYNNSLNMMRQSVSCAFIILAGVYLLGNNGKIDKKVIICYAIAVLFHKSAPIGIVSSFVLIFISYRKMLKWIKFLIYAGIILLPTLIVGIVDLLSYLGLLSESYIWYANIFVYGTIDIDWFINPFSPYALADVLFRTVLICVPYLYNTKRNTVVIRTDGYLYSALRNAVTSGYLIYMVILYSLHTMYGGRISLFLDMFGVILLPCAVQNSKKRTRTIKLIILVGVLILYWSVWVIRLGWSGSNYYDFRF